VFSTPFVSTPQPLHKTATISTTIIKTANNVAETLFSQSISQQVDNVAYFDFVIPANSASTNYTPVGFTAGIGSEGPEIQYLYLAAFDGSVILRMAQAGAPYTIPAGGTFLVQYPTTSLGNNRGVYLQGGPVDARVRFIVGQLSQLILT